jgi:ABC-2 type transport system permease protein
VSPLFLVAARDLRSMARGWLAWILVAGALLVQGLAFYALGLAAEGPRLSGDVLGRFFDAASGGAIVVGAVIGMRAVAAEQERGTLSLLTTAPVSEAAIVGGKFLAGMAVLAALQLASLHLPALVAVTHLAIGYLGVLLIGAAALAIGLLASTIARSQAVAAVLSAVVLVGLLLTWVLARTADSPWSDALAGLSLHHAHQRPFLRGVLAPQHVVYYASVTATALVAAARALAARRWT